MSKRIKITLITLTLVTTLIFSFGAGCITVPQAIPSTASQRDVGIVEEVWDIVFRNYVEADKLDADKLREGAIRGMLDALDDPYTTYLTPRAFQLSQTELHGSFDGIGATVGVRDGKLMIIAPLPSSPAFRAGIKPGDQILEVDGRSTEGMGVEEAVSLIRGTRGTLVTLLVLHEGETEAVEIEIIRAEIKLTSVFFEMRDDIAHIIITHFNENTDEELIPVLAEVNRGQAAGIILDVRSNPGGLLNEVVDVTSHFLKEGIVVSVVDNRGNKTSDKVKTTSLTTDLPMVVLTDNFSASGSEVLAGALQDHGRATIAGTKTFGKGSVNQLNRLSNGAGLYITIARWLTPNGRLIEGEGIIPDIELDLEGEDAVNWAIDYLKGKRKGFISPTLWRKAQT
ncbi:MAG: S41 family peptidase [Chloroflexi bacterium]|nr:S41 family peptidase [Chloroflexota bacterium]